MTDQELATLRLELRVGRILGRSMIGKLQPVDDPDRPLMRQDRGQTIRRHFPNAVVAVGGKDLVRRLQAMPDDGCSTLYDHNGRVIHRVVGVR